MKDSNGHNQKYISSSGNKIVLLGYYYYIVYCAMLDSGIKILYQKIITFNSLQIF